MKFLDKPAPWLEVAEQRHEKHQKVHHENKSTRSLVASATRSCILCGEIHAVYSCEKFANLDVSKRQEKARELNLCTNCLAKGHLRSSVAASSVALNVKANTTVCYMLKIIHKKLSILLLSRR